MFRHHKPCPIFSRIRYITYYDATFSLNHVGYEVLLSHCGFRFQLNSIWRSFYSFLWTFPRSSLLARKWNCWGMVAHFWVGLSFSSLSLYSKHCWLRKLTVLIHGNKLCFRPQLLWPRQWSHLYKWYFKNRIKYVLQPLVGPSLSDDRDKQNLLKPIDINMSSLILIFISHLPC